MIDKVEVALPEHEKFDLERAKLLQEKELKEKEFALKEKELDLQHRHSWLARWSTPSVVAIIAGLIGYIGTLISSAQNRHLEREKQEGTIILEAIKTSGTSAEKEKQTSANLVFLADAGLITSIRKTEVDKLRIKAQGAGPSLPAPQPTPPGVEFKRSSTLTSELQAKLQSALLDYQASLARIGYDAGQAKDRIVVRVDEEFRDNSFFDNASVAVGVDLASDPEYVLSEYTWYVLKQANLQNFQTLWNATSGQTIGFGYGLKNYLTCSYLNSPYIGKNYYALVKRTGAARQYLGNLDELRVFDKDGGPDALEAHKLGEIWGGAFWEIRKAFGLDKTDRLLFATWKGMQLSKATNTPKFFIDAIVETSKAAGNARDEQVIRQAFTRRKLS